MVKKLLILISLITFSAQSQKIEQNNLLSYNIGKNIKNYRIKSKLAYHDKRFDDANALFDSLVNNVINGSRMDNFTARKLSGKKIEFKDYDKPVFLMTYASWCTPGVGEIPALNDVAKKYSDKIDFVVLFWDNKSNAKKATKKYNSKINVLYIDEADNKHCRVIRLLKHSVGFPSSFFIDSEDVVIQMNRGISHHFKEDYNTSYNLNYNSFTKGISVLMNSSSEQVDDYTSIEE
ncbi:thiol-disulfide oxidoreductase [unidentified eubacterium SCB49]|nr:thiol-disulfide oxidoreductase [unidentified eubacterium SCB49]